jgi:molecular chaperone GrpE
MSSKKPQSPEANEKMAPESVPEEMKPAQNPAAEGTQEVSSLIVELHKQLAEAQSQAAEYKDGWQRSVAEFQNYKRRVDTEKSEAYQMAVGNIVRRYLPVLDDLERALSARPAGLAWADGIDLICRKLKSILESEGIKRIEAEGQVFDPNFHEAISQEPSEDHESGEVIAVIRNGYLLGDKVIRPAQVRVAK